MPRQSRPRRIEDDPPCCCLKSFLSTMKAVVQRDSACLHSRHRRRRSLPELSKLASTKAVENQRKRNLRHSSVDSSFDQKRTSKPEYPNFHICSPEIFIKQQKQKIYDEIFKRKVYAFYESLQWDIVDELLTEFQQLVAELINKKTYPKKSLLSPYLKKFSITGKLTRRNLINLRNSPIKYQLAHSTPINSRDVFYWEPILLDESNTKPKILKSALQTTSFTTEAESYPSSPTPFDLEREAIYCSFNFGSRNSLDHVNPNYDNNELWFTSCISTLEQRCYSLPNLSPVSFTPPPPRRRVHYAPDVNLDIDENRPYNANIYSRYYRRNRMITKIMNTMTDHDRKVIIEFCHLLEKSKQLFNGLRELPQYGYKQWHSYFGRTFDLYSKLWKFQQEHRSILNSKYGLKRWQIGEIASKIGQLYYHFYLRTSEATYLNEAYSFYSAIRNRSYYTKACKEDRCELMVKKLRYYARFIVVSLLLKKNNLVWDLIKELDKQIVEYGNKYDPDDQLEWAVVVDEVKAFLQAEPVVSVLNADNYPVMLLHRLTDHTLIPMERTPQMTLTLQDAVIVGSSSQQVKFSELTLDMFRMLQTLEREPTGVLQHVYDNSPRPRFISPTSAPNEKGFNLETSLKGENPHKFLLFKPSTSQVLMYLSNGCNDLPPNGALLLYLSADGFLVPGPKHSDEYGYEVGGILTAPRSDTVHRDANKDLKLRKSNEIQCLHPGDLYPFTRKPLFIIVDSDNSYVFQHIPNHFGQPLVTLMSPLELPSSFLERKQNGSLFTLFLHSPLIGFCLCCDINTISQVHWEHAQTFVDNFMVEASLLVTKIGVDSTYMAFFGDDFFRQLLLRYIFCEAVLRAHRAFRGRTQLTRCSPILPDELFDNLTLQRILIDLAAHLQVRNLFHDPAMARQSPVQ